MGIWCVCEYVRGWGGRGGVVLDMGPTLYLYVCVLVNVVCVFVCVCARACVRACVLN